MMNRRMLIMILTIALILTSCSGTNTAQSPIRASLPSGISSQADWASRAETVEELMLEADLVVRARVSEAPVTRVLRRELSVLDENGNIVGSTISETLFSDTIFEIIKTYQGEPSLNITVMQTGGFDPKISNAIEEVIDDPFYKVGEEYVLFLVDISGDPVQAPDRQLYRIVNPFGRYKIEDGNRVYSFGQNPKSNELPGILDIHALEAQIELAIKKLNK